jgi:hypothetical protein
MPENNFLISNLITCIDTLVVRILARVFYCKIVQGLL